MRTAVVAVSLAWVVSPARAQPAAVVPVPAAALEVAAGYAAKVLASARFVSGRDVDAVLAEEFAPETALEKFLRPLLRVAVDATAGTLTVRAGAVARTAVHRPGLGCTLALGVTPEALARQVVSWPEWPADVAARPWPYGDAVAEAAWPEGVDRAALQAAVDDAFRERAERPIRTRAVVVVHEDRLLYERYADGIARDMPLAGWSMTKSVVNALVGIRVRQGELDPEQPVPIPDWQGADDPRRALTWRVLLQMSSGLAWEESYDDPGSAVPRMLFAEPSAGGYAAQRELAHAPGTRFQYSSGSTNLLCRGLRATFATAADYLAFPRRELFARVGMRTAVIEPDASGTFVGSSFMLASARDWARFGLLYLHDGVWDGQRILPQGWVRASTTPAPAAGRGRYGLHWWLNAGERAAAQQRPAPALPADMFAANGFQGQTLVVIPSRRLVLVRLGCTKHEADFDDRALVAAVLAALPP